MVSIDKLIRLLGSEKPVDRRAGAYGLEKLGRDSVTAVPALTGALAHDPDAEVRWRCAATLAGLGRRAVDAFAAVSEALSDPDPVVRWNCCEATKAIAESCYFSGVVSLDDTLTGTAVEQLLKLFYDPSPTVRWCSVGAIGWLGQAARPAIPALVRALADAILRVRWSAVKALGLIGPAAQPAVPALVAALKDQWPVRSNCALAFGHIQIDTAITVPALVELLLDESRTVRCSACLGLGSIGPAAGPAALALRTMLQEDKDRDARLAAKWAIRSIERHVD